MELVSTTRRAARHIKRQTGICVNEVLERTLSIYVDGDKIVGFIVFVPATMAPDVFHIFKEYREQGLGKAAARHLMYMSPTKFMTIFSQASTIGFWEKLGFHRTTSTATADQKSCVKMHRRMLLNKKENG
jgi:predicted acetyltransferase